ncbi:dephospho-CoA kinase [Mycoplasmopsis verecunda]|uniref:Dephospho-CoA kinase n=1 Tax=Mycoplasmopsis verecunda TaxID=171291 RepID=A0A1T4KDA3_9BACT|nr:dephospho-CoA kinase [Mycoplasmopsis verecunda]WPB54861.1 dephospho-CoA kinase [Mycoplasmopsis verecunda]SJZ40412.1 dephospho-CoA kinase [Mycoplasmopsis verecunda]
MIAIVGKIASGKTTFLNYCKNLGYSTLNCDHFVTDLYNHNEEFIAKINEKYGDLLVTNNYVDKKKIKNWILQDISNLEKIEKEVIFYIKKHLLSNKYDFVEIPILFSKNVDFSNFFAYIFNMQIEEKTRQIFLKNKGVDNFVLNILDNQNNYNWELEKTFNGVEIVNISLDKRNNLTKIKKLLAEYI